MSTAARPMLTGIVDLHSHFIPGVDDGARTPDEALRALRRMAGQGCATCVTTPHFDASLSRDRRKLAQRLGEFDRAFDALGAACAEYMVSSGRTDLPLLLRGAEVMLDEPEPDLSSHKLRLAGGRFILCEFPALRLPANPELAITALVLQGWIPVVAHPERYRNLDPDLDALRKMREAGAYFQVNAGSLTGKHGANASALIRRILTEGLASFMASDFHARGTPQLADAVAELDAVGGRKLAERLLVDNPRRILIGGMPEASPAIPREQASSWWRRLLSGTRD